MSTQRPLRNIFTRIDRKQLESIIKECSSIGQVFRRLNLNITGAQYNIFRRTMERFGIDIRGLTSSPAKGFGHPEKSNADMFKSESNVSASTMKKRIIRDNLKPYCCEFCGNEGAWRGELLVLQLDHIDGDRRNNELTNLRFLCPNCHTQTPTHSQGGKRLAKLKREKKLPTCQCGCVYHGYGKTCHKCAMIRISVSKNKEWPDIDIVKEMVWKQPVVKVAKHFNKSANGLKKFCIRNGIALPPVGYWQRRDRGYSHEESLISRSKLRAPKKRISQQQIDEAKKIMVGGLSLRAAAKVVGCCHSTLLDRLKGDPVLLISKHKNAKHNRLNNSRGIDQCEPKNGCSAPARTEDIRVTT